VDLFSIENKVALVTGGSRGIGLMIARGYVEAGAKVYVSSRKARACEEVADELGRHGACVAPRPIASGSRGSSRRASPRSTCS
jgi:NAD(P)-dependent dehydrogenase (short-subunit alcohol dehydrogenase family)